MARPRKTLAATKKNLTKAEIEQKQQQEERIKIDGENLSAPSYLTDRAKEEFERVVREAKKIEIFDNLDLSILAIYSSAYAQYLEITEEIQNMGQGFRYVTADNKISPLINAQDKIIKQIMTCSSKLGLATTDRLKLIVPKKEESETNKYLRYLDG